MMPNASRTEAPALHRCRYPHVWSWCFKLLEDRSLPLLAVELLGLLVEWSALLDNCETLDIQRLAGLLACCDPRTEDSLRVGAGLLAHNLAGFGLLEGGSSVPRLGLADLPRKDMTPCELGRDWLLLHGLHCFGHCRKGFVGEGSRIK